MAPKVCEADWCEKERRRKKDPGREEDEDNAVLAAFLPPLPSDAFLGLPLPIGPPGLLNGHDGREGVGEEPAPPVAADPEAAAAGVHALEVAAVHAGLVARGAGDGGGGEEGLLHLAVLLDELPGDDAEDLLDALAA